jgi:DNA processing protein
VGSRADERAALLALLREQSRGWAEVTEQVEARGSALELLMQQTLAGQGELLGPAPEELAQERVSAAARAIEAWEARGFAVVTFLEADYPAQLLTVHQRPPFLFYRGKLDPADARSVAVVGTRKPTDEGLQQARAVAMGLAERGVTVVSGLAAGIDTAAHRGALDAGGRTVAVIGTGLEHSYPAANAELQERIATEHLVLSQFWPENSPTRHSFPMRNAVMSGFAAATVVIEAAAQSGARMQARLAQQHGRPVFLMRRLLQHEWARTYAARPNTTVVDTADEVLEHLRGALETGDELVWA